MSSTPEPRKMVATRDAYADALVELGRARQDVVVLDADLAKSTKTEKFKAAFADRFFDMGIAEQNMMGTAAGLAASGKIPFVSSFAIFATGRAWEQVRNTVAYSGLNVKIAATHAGLSVGEDGSSHQALEDIALMRAISGMTVIVPADAVATRKAVFAAVDIPGPVYIRLGRPAVPIVYGGDFEFRPGKGQILREGRDVAIIAAGLMVSLAIEAWEILREQGVSATVADACTIKPMDAELVVELASRCGAVVTAEEHTIIGGLGSAVAEILCERFPAPLERVGVRDRFGQSGSPSDLFREYGLTPSDIASAALRAIAKKKQLASRNLL